MKENLSLLSQLVRLSMADGELDEMEYKLMSAMAKMLGIDSSALDRLLQNPTQLQVPKSEFDRILQFHRLVLLANVDTEVVDEELETLRRCGLKLGLRPEAVEAVLLEMKSHPNGMLPTPVMLQIFQRYHN